ncbi:MAG: cytochrome C [Rhodospirillaceae bacterium]|nr:MAG: cytochrome C [Rhodospirillaceae bacterium]
MKVRIAAVAMFGVLSSASMAAAQTGDAAKGERVFGQCKTCHTVDKGGKNGVGPNLAGVFGRKAGTADGFKFSEAMTGSGIVWDDKALAEYLKDPKGRIPGNKMIFVGIKRQDQLDDLIAYLQKASR